MQDSAKKLPNNKVAYCLLEGQPDNSTNSSIPPCCLNWQGGTFNGTS